MENFGNRKSEGKEQGVSIYSRSINLLDDDPLEEIFALNLGDFLTEHLINPELAHKIGDKVRDKNESLKEQLRELVSIYSIDNTLSLLGFKNNEDYVIYNSIAKTIKLMLSLDECNIYLSKKGEKLKFVEMAEKNAKITLENKAENEVNVIEEIKEILKLPNIPRKIESFDISNISRKFYGRRNGSSKRW